MQHVKVDRNFFRIGVGRGHFENRFPGRSVDGNQVVEEMDLLIGKHQLRQRHSLLHQEKVIFVTQVEELLLLIYLVLHQLVIL